MVNILIKNGLVITMDEDRRIIKDGAVAIEKDRIVALGKTEELGVKYADKVIDVQGNVVMPGLVNTHVHLFQSLLRSLGDDLKLFDWCAKMLNPIFPNLTEDDCYFGALLGCLEMIKSGTTCASDFHYVYTKPTLGDYIVKAMIDSGIRGIVARGFMDTDEAKIVPFLIEEGETALKRSEEFVRRWNGAADKRIHISLAPGPPPWGSPELLKDAKELANKLKVGVQLHIAETLDEVKIVKSLFRKRPIEFLNTLGILDPELLAVHCVWATDKEIRMLKATDSKVSHNPTSNMYLASGVAPVPRIIKAGVTVGLGTDGAASNNNLDMFEAMKFAVLLHKVHNLDPTIIAAEKVLEMATIEGARALGLEKDIGSLELGKKADITIVNIKQLNTSPINRAFSQLVYCANGSNADTVIIDGKILMENRQITVTDEQQVIKRAQEQADDLVKRSGVEYLRETSAFQPGCSL